MVSAIHSAVTSIIFPDSREVGRGAERENDPLHQLRQAHKGDGDIADIAGQPGKQRRAADLLYLLNLGIEDAFNKLTAQTIDKMVAEGG